MKDLSKFRTTIAGVLIGLSIAIILVFRIYYSMSDQDREELVFSSFGMVTIAAVILGGVLSGYAVTRYMVGRLKGKWSKVGCILGGILIAPLSIQDGIAFGSVGIDYGELLGGQLGMHVGLLVSITLGVIIIEFLGGLFGIITGRVAEYLYLRHFGHE